MANLWQPFCLVPKRCHNATRFPTPHTCPSTLHTPVSTLRERGLYVGIHTWLYTFTYRSQPIEGEGTVIPLINSSPENEKTLKSRLTLKRLWIQTPIPCKSYWRVWATVVGHWIQGSPNQEVTSSMNAPAADESSVVRWVYRYVTP